MAKKKQRDQKRRERRRRQEAARAKGRSIAQPVTWDRQTSWASLPMSFHEEAWDLFGSMSSEERVAAIQHIVKTAESEFQREYFSLGEWFERYDALHLLAYCCAYFICHPVGVDPEANGEFEFYPHSLEILQAFSLMQKRSFSTRPLGPDAQDILDLMSTIGQAASIRGYKSHFNQVDGDSEMNLVLHGMSVQTMAVRNPGYPHHIRQVTLELAATVREDFLSVHAIDPVTLVETLLELQDVSLARLKEHRSRIARAFRETSYEKVASTYVESFRNVQDFDADRLFALMGSDLDSFKAALLYYSDMMIEDCFVFTLDDLLGVYGENADREAVKNVIEKLAFQFGDLQDSNKEWVILNNPVWERPFIKIYDETYFWR